MAEAIGLAAGLTALATFAFQAACALRTTIEGIKSHSRRIQNIQDELTALSEVLASLTDLVNSNAGIPLPALELPLFRCGNTCKEFEREIMKISTHSNDSRSSIRDWAKLRYMGGNIDDLRQSLAAYKLTIAVALADANLRAKAIDNEQIESCKTLISGATKNLETHLENIDERLDMLIGKSAAQAGPGSSELKILKEEQLSTHKCLEICAHLSGYISRLELDTRVDGTAPDGLPERLIHEGFQEMKLKLQQTTARLELHLQDVLDRLLAKSKASLTSEDDISNVSKLRDEWDLARQSIAMCDKVNEHLQENIGSIENYGTGDSIQFMLSTTGKVLRGVNRGLGWRNRQLGGYMDAETARQLSADMLGKRSPSHEEVSTSSKIPDPSSTKETSEGAHSGTQHDGHHGQGKVLGPMYQTASFQEARSRASDIPGAGGTSEGTPERPTKTPATR